MAFIRLTPMKNPDAIRYDQLHYDEAIDQRLGIMDLSAMIMCRDNAMELCVFNMFKEGALMDVLAGKSVGTRVN